MMILRLVASPFTRVRRGLASYRQAIESLQWMEEYAPRCGVCGRRGTDGCDPAYRPHPRDPSPSSRLARARRSFRLSWRLRASLPEHLRHPQGSLPASAGTHSHGSETHSLSAPF